MSFVEGLSIILSGAVLAGDELESGGVVAEGIGAVLEGDGGTLGLIDELELDDIAPELGGVDGLIDDELEEPEGEGATTGGVFDVLLGVSRWQPATPSTNPLHNNVIKALLMVISRSG